MNRLTGSAVVILGAPRSGTSLAADVVRRLGYFLGEDADFPEAKVGNPAGIFERGEILAFNQRAIETLYLGHDRPDLVAMEEHPAFPRLVEEATTLLRALFAGRPKWGWKEPISTLLMPVYRAALARDEVDTAFLLCVRRPSEVIASQLKIVEAAESRREAPIGSRAYRRWMNYTLKSLESTAGSPRTMLLYEDLLDRPRETISTLCRGVACGSSVDSACEAVLPALHRNRGGEDVPADAPAAVHETWALCRRVAADPDGLAAGEFDEDIGRIRTEFDLLAACFAEPEPPYGEVSFTVPGFANPFGGLVLPSRGWNTIDVEIPGQAGVDLIGTLYPLPANVYIRNVRWDDGIARIRAINDTVASQEGESMKFALGFSSPQVLLRTPIEPGPYRLRMEVYVEMNIFTAMDSLLRQTRKTRALEQQLAEGHKQFESLRERSLRLEAERERPRA